MAIESASTAIDIVVVEEGVLRLLYFGTMIQSGSGYVVEIGDKAKSMI
jgi:hypothetical protein